ncbi:MAG: arginase [Flavobacteriales bacterium]|jgi:arginase
MIDRFDWLFLQQIPRTMENIKYLEITSELGAGTRGASLGIDAMRVASWKTGSSILTKYPLEIVANHNELLWTPVTTKNGKYIAGIAKVYQNIADATEKTLKKGDFPVILAGDHSTAGGTIAGIKAAYPNKRLGIVWVDAHADLHTPHTTPSGNVHGMPLATALGTDNIEKAINEIKDETKVAWETMKNLGGICPKILPEDLVFVAVRDTEDPENYLMDKLQIRNFTVAEVNNKGPKEIGEQVLKLLEPCDMIYISFDVDSMDCDLVSNGTGTPVKNGLSPEQTGELLETLVADEKIIAFEIVEVNPCLDNKCNTMAEVALERLIQVVHILENK